MSSALDEFERQLVTASRELHHAAHGVAPAPSVTRPEPTRNRWPRRRARVQTRRLLVVLVALMVVAGGVAAASTLLLWPAQRLAEGSVNCFMATHGTGALDHRTLAVGGVRANGQPPINACRTWYRRNDYRLNGSQTGPKVAALPLIACQENATTVGVYVATGQLDQCKTLGEKPLSQPYADATARLRDLQTALLAVQNRKYCASVQSIARQTQAVLAARGFANWRVITPPPDPAKHWLFGYPLPAGTGGACGTLLLGPPSQAIDIDTQHQTVTVSVGPPRTTAVAVERIMVQLWGATGQRCYTLASFRPLAQRAFAPVGLRPRFAIVAGQQGVSYGSPPEQRLFEQGCIRTFLAVPGDDNRFIDVLLVARHAPRLPPGQVYPPASAFRP